MRNQLINDLYSQLNIDKSNSIDSMAKAIYSASGRIALASLWDNPENCDFISIQHFKSRASKVLNAYINIYPEIESIYPIIKDELVDEIYNIYLRNGFFYHSSHKIYPSQLITNSFESCAFYRGISPEEECYMSGLGLYKLQKNTNQNKSVSEMFDLPQEPLSEYLNNILREDNWSTIDWSEGTEFLRMNPPFSKKYWKLEPDKISDVSLARYGTPIKIYVFYRWNNDHFEQQPISNWILEDYRSTQKANCNNYIRIAAAILYSHENLPPINVKLEGQLANIRLGYRLPPEEEDFFKLYSWPINYNITSEYNQIFHREMNINVYQFFKKHLISIGYKIVEV